MSKVADVEWKEVMETGCTPPSEGPVSGDDICLLMEEHSVAVLSYGMVKGGLRALWSMRRQPAFTHSHPWALAAPPLHIYPEPLLPTSGSFCSFREARSHFLRLNKGRRLNLHPGVITNLPFGRARKGSTLILPTEGWKPWHQGWKPQEPKSTVGISSD